MHSDIFKSDLSVQIILGPLYDLMWFKNQTILHNVFLVSSQIRFCHKIVC